MQDHSPQVLRSCEPNTYSEHGAPVYLSCTLRYCSQPVSVAFHLHKTRSTSNFRAQFTPYTQENTIFTPIGVLDALQELTLMMVLQCAPTSSTPRHVATVRKNLRSGLPKRSLFYDGLLASTVMAWAGQRWR